MTAFIPKKLPLEDSPGEILRRNRHQQNFKIEDIAKRTNIQAKYLIALEEERWESLPAGLYGKNFLKEYALFLKLNPDDLLKNWDNQNLDEQSDPFSKKIVKGYKFLIFPRIIRNIMLATAVLICFLYLIFYFKNIVSPPSLIITQPEKSFLTEENSLLVNGITEPEAEVKINGVLVLNNDNGNFSQLVNLKKGVNNLIITAQKKYSREESVTRQILVK